MSYDLGVDLGTTFTAAAIARDGRAETVPLASTGAVIPSVAYLNEDGDLLFGQLAERRAATEPARVAREFKRRIGDPTPLLLGGTPVSAEMVMARMLSWVVDQVATTEGAPPARLAVTHPANWGDYKLDLFKQAARHVNLTIDELIAEPVAAANFYLHSRPGVRNRLADGSALVVYDLGGGTFDAAVVRGSHPDGLTIAGQPDGVDRLGGIDVDHAVLGHVTTNLGLDPENLDRDDPAVAAALSQLRQDCVAAKEALSDETDTSIPVLLPDQHTEVRLTRAELEAMIRPTLDETVVALQRTIGSADITSEAIEAVLLVGGSSRIPLVGQLVAGELNRPIAVDTRPKDAICHGAALSLNAGDDTGDAGATGAVPSTPATGSPAAGGGAAPVPVGGAAAAGGLAGAAAAGGDVPPTRELPVDETALAATGGHAPPPVADSPGAVPAGAGGVRGFNPLWPVVGVLAIGAVILGAVLLTQSGGDDDPTEISDSSNPPATENGEAADTGAVERPGGTTTSEPTTTTTEQETTTTTGRATTTAPSDDDAPSPDPSPQSDGRTLTVDGSYDRWGGSCYYDSHGASRPVTAEPAAACRDGRGPSYYTRTVADGATVQGACWRQDIDLGDDLGNRSSTWIQLDGGGWMNALYFSNWQSATDGLPSC